VEGGWEWQALLGRVIHVLGVWWNLLKALRLEEMSGEQGTEGVCHGGTPRGIRRLNKKVSHRALVHAHVLKILRLG